MKHIKCTNSQEWIQLAEDWLASQKSKGARSLFLPAGNTCIPIYEALNTKSSLLNDFDLFQIDEVITGSKKGLFADFFKTYLGRLNRPVRPLEDGQAKADLAWLGLGLNGHIGFHEPGIPKDFGVGCVRLSVKTCETLGLEANSWGLTYGASRFLECEALLMLVRGASKAEILSQFLAKDKNLPATSLVDHKSFTVLTEGL